ncbi:hypothetical protein SPRG_03238 [Saprolegnia parasitica CBS 223.65]|uniref:Uncharacterized protein n=1 Tax=Saprolegnia parasitica (strain CBS 223.65) TaxID=695850 RepID=A0A067CZR4_SAPPC|nr:hypothetical protein SPRG_03238 [Saprolegnia parasitica CBS 223.65]KDO32021.1 hypothetical protein SPRG_03238 [Saprolegnia parasitica CBS 223.65]|eukprot:XP_012197211.1 hypothetical protein SPRG_03238 [Saprolegnia parasitica CBS 223.65]
MPHHSKTISAHVVLRNTDLFHLIAEYQGGLYHDLQAHVATASSAWLEMLHKKTFAAPRPQLLSDYMAQQSMYAFFGHIEPTNQATFAFHLSILQGDAHTLKRWLRCRPNYATDDAIELATYCDHAALVADLRRAQAYPGAYCLKDAVPPKKALSKLRYIEA